jgi:hypothetical protein
MAEDAPVEMPVAAEPVAEAEQPAAAEAQPEQPAAEAEQAADAEAGQKRGRDEEAAEIDGEPDAKRPAPADGEASIKQLLTIYIRVISDAARLSSCLHASCCCSAPFCCPHTGRRSS